MFENKTDAKEMIYILLHDIMIVDDVEISYAVVDIANAAFSLANNAGTVLTPLYDKILTEILRLHGESFIQEILGENS